MTIVLLSSSFQDADDDRRLIEFQKTKIPIGLANQALRDPLSTMHPNEAAINEIKA